MNCFNVIAAFSQFSFIAGSLLSMQCRVHGMCSWDAHACTMLLSERAALKFMANAYTCLFSFWLASFDCGNGLCRPSVTQ